MGTRRVAVGISLAHPSTTILSTKINLLNLNPGFPLATNPSAPTVLSRILSITAPDRCDLYQSWIGVRRTVSIISGDMVPSKDSRAGSVKVTIGDFGVYAASILMTGEGNVVGKLSVLEIDGRWCSRARPSAAPAPISGLWTEFGLGLASLAFQNGQ